MVTFAELYWLLASSYTIRPTFSSRRISEDGYACGSCGHAMFFYVGSMLLPGRASSVLVMWIRDNKKLPLEKQAAQLSSLAGNCGIGSAPGSTMRNMQVSSDAGRQVPQRSKSSQENRHCKSINELRPSQSSRFQKRGRYIQRTCFFFQVSIIPNVSRACASTPSDAVQARIRHPPSQPASSSDVSFKGFSLRALPSSPYMNSAALPLDSLSSTSFSLCSTDSL